ncbi:sulfatase [Gracilibacillus sp. D59]|uniref:sulfatase n=1 Tax=Gracilibacillus sp. D59 TaxID=3457434 RepID=UPI003FCC5434
MDSVNRNMLQTYNHQTWVKTPNIDRLAKKSMIFDNHWAGSLPCMPARRDIQTGRLNFLERKWGGIEPFDVTLPQILRDNNIFTHITTDHYHYFSTGGENYCQQFDTWDFYRGQESDPWVSNVNQPSLPDHYYGQVRKQYELNRTNFVSEEDFSGPKTMQSACKWLDANHHAEQFFLTVEAFDPHEPFDCPEYYVDQYKDNYEGPRYEWPKYGPAEEPLEATEHIQKKYAGTLTMIDHWFGKFLDKLDQYDLWEDTLVIFTTDHGFLLGEHELLGKNVMNVYNELAHLPLLIHLPGSKRAGERIDAITQNIDLMPTILDFYDIGIPDRIKGHSLKEMLDKENNKVRDVALYGYYGVEVNITDGYYTYFRSPKDDNQPLFLYTAMPTTHREFITCENEKEIECGRFLPYTDFPVFKIPQKIGKVRIYKNQPLRQTRLYHIKQDYLQHHPIIDETIEKSLAKKMKQAMKEAGAPEEQFTRLGL